MIGLSTTAIGHRPLADAMTIFQHLKPLMNLDYLELAVGTQNDTSYQYPDVPLVLHDSCLFSNGRRHHLYLEDPESWLPYRSLVQSHLVLEFHLHAPAKDLMTSDELIIQLHRLQDYLQVPVRLEVMVNPHQHATSLDDMPDFPLVLDISQINIWAKGDTQLTQAYYVALIDRSPTIHLSHNDGYNDHHDLIPSGHWTRNLTFNDKLVTYESLPVEYAKYQRRDFSRKKYTKQV